MISIIIPTLNEEKVLAQTLTALRELNTIDYEIIVSDGFSNDRTLEIARKYADKVVEHDGKTRQNISIGRNAGAKIAQGEYLVFIDADVIIPNINNFFVEALKQFESRQTVALTVRVQVYPDQETFGDRLMYGFLNWGINLKNNILHIGESSGEFQMIRKSIFDSLRGFREDLITREDADMFSRLSKVGRAKYYSKLNIFHSGRRAHAMSWFRLYPIWVINTIWVWLFNKAFSKEWKVIR